MTKWNVSYKNIHERRHIVILWRFYILKNKFCMDLAKKYDLVGKSDAF